MFYKRVLKVLSNLVLSVVFFTGYASAAPRVSAKEAETVPDFSVSSNPSSVHFAAIGDYGLAGQAELDVANQVKSWNPDFIVTLGDNNYNSGSASTIDANIGQYYHDFIFPYTGSYGAGAATNSFFPVLGNHDWVATNAQPYLNYFSLPGNERYYDFVQGPVHFFMLDSDGHEPDGTTSTSAQATWLKDSLSASSSSWNIILLHHAPFSSANHGSHVTLQWPYEAWGADAVLAGHDHTYERIIKGTIPYFVNGLSGSSIYNFGAPIAGSQLRYNANYGAMLVDATSAYINFKFITRTGAVIDSFTLGTVPLSASVNSIICASANPTSAMSVDFTVTFSESVTGVNTGDFRLTTTGVSGAAVSGVSGMGSVYTVTVNAGSGSGTIRLDLIDDDSIVNAALTPLGGAGAGNGNFTSGETYTVTKTTSSLTTLVNSVLPTSRTIPVGNTATIFNTVVNAGTSTASGITLSMNPVPAGTFIYQQTNCATNAIIGSPNPSLDLAPGGVLCYVLSFTPSATFAATNVHIRAQASNAPSTNLLIGINTWLLRAASVAGPDIIALTTTTDFHQVSCSGTNAFAVALSNVGAAATGDITVTANTGSAIFPLSISISETDPSTGAIIGDNVLQSVGAGENRTVAVFVTFNGCISFDPAVSRIFIEFRDASNNVVGSTSTAVSTNR